MLRLLVVSCVAGVLAGCGRGDFALQVQVTAPADSRSVCTRVTATRGAESLESDSAIISANDPVDLIIALDSAAAVTVQAAGYDTADCVGTPIERSEPGVGTPTKTAPFPVVALTLTPVTTTTDGGTDAGFDGGADAGFDGGLDDAGFDGGTDDAGFDGGTDDAGFDDAGAPDAGPACTLATVGQSCAGATGTCNFEGACIANFPYAPSNFDVSDLPATDGGVVLDITGSATLNVDAGIFIVPSLPMPPFRFIASDAGYAQVMLIHVDQLNVSGTLNLVGDIPVIIAVSGDATISGSIFARAGGNAPTCGNGAGQTGQSASYTWSGGGGGGGFGADGAAGGASGGTTMLGGERGTENGVGTLTPLRGGCPGGTAATAGGPGGWSGGALQLSVGGHLEFTGKVTAPGRGGTGGSTQGKGGGGGGSGGGLLLEADSLRTSSTARATANGGSGAGGASQSGNGQDGNDGETDTANPAVGGAGGTNGSYDGRAGGAGGTATSGAADGGSGSGGGGGGGGGVGRIRFNANSACINPGAVISPAQTTNGGAFAFDAGC